MWAGNLVFFLMEWCNFLATINLPKLIDGRHTIIITRFSSKVSWNLIYEYLISALAHMYVYRSGGSSLLAIRVSGKSNLIYAAAICTDRLIIIIRSDCIRPVINGEPENSVPILLGAVRDAFPGKPVGILWNLTRAYIYTLSYNDQKIIKWKKSEDSRCFFNWRQR